MNKSQGGGAWWLPLARLASLPHFYQVSGRWLPWLTAASLVVLLAGMVWALAYVPPDYRQGHSFRIMYVHVPSAVVALAGYYLMAVSGAVALIWRVQLAEILLYACAPLGAWMTFLALATGAIWGKPTWGTFWVWDARGTSMVILLLLYLGVAALYDAFDNKRTAARACAILSLIGTVNIPIIYKSVDWWYSLHQPASLRLWGESSIHPQMLYPLLLMIAGFYLLFAAALLLNARLELLRRERHTGWLARRIREQIKEQGNVAI